MHTDNERKSPAALVEEGYQVWLWVDARVAGFPALARRQLGHRLLDALLDALAGTTQAVYLPRGREQVVQLHAVNRSLAVARILLRGARDRRYLSIAQHEHAMPMGSPGAAQAVPALLRLAAPGPAPLPSEHRPSGP